MTPKQKVTVNGNLIETSLLPCSLDQFLEQHGFLPKSVVVEHNEEAMAPSMFAQSLVQDGDRLEIVRITAGG